MHIYTDITSESFNIVNKIQMHAAALHPCFTCAQMADGGDWGLSFPVVVHTFGMTRTTDLGDL